MEYVVVFGIIFILMVIFAIVSPDPKAEEKKAEIENVNKTITSERNRAYVFGLDKYRVHVFSEYDYINSMMYANDVMENTKIEKEGSLSTAGAIGYGLAGLGGGIAAAQGMAEENEKIRKRNADNIAFSTKRANDIMTLSESLYSKRDEARNYNDSLSKEYDIVLSDPDVLFQKYDLKEVENNMNNRSSLFIGERDYSLTMFFRSRSLCENLTYLSGSLLAKLYDSNNNLCGCAYLDLDESNRVPDGFGRTIKANAKKIAKSKPYRVKLEPFVLWEVAKKDHITDSKGNRKEYYKDTITKEEIIAKAKQKEIELNNALYIRNGQSSFIPGVN